MKNKVRVFRFAFGGDGFEQFHICVAGKNRKDAEKRFIRNLQCLEQIPELVNTELDIDE